MNLTTTCTASLLAVILLSLAACGGGGSGSSTNPVTSTPQPDSQTVAGARVAGASQLHDAAVLVAGSLPQFGSVVQSVGVNVASVSGISSTFDGNLALTVSRADGSSTTLSTASHTLERSGTLTSFINGHNARTWGLAEVTGNGVSIARIIVSWDNNDVSDYLSGGYWAHLPGDTQALRFTGAEVGAFVDGPELSLSNPPTMPLQGSASYSGVAAGIYGIEYGTDAAAFTGYARNSIEVGEFDSVIDLTADFGAGTVSGCVGCTGGVYVTGYVSDAVTGEAASFADVHSPTWARLGTTPFASDGTFRGQSVILESSLYTVSNSGGAWGGQFSNIPDSAGVPRLAAGTFAGQGTTAGGSEAVFVGAFGAGQQ